MDVIDIIAPLKEIRIKGNSKSWFDSEILERINIREKLRKKHKKSGLQIDFENFKNAQKQAQQIIKAKKCDYIKEQLRINKAKPAKLWKTLKSLGMSSKGSNGSKVCLKDNDVTYFEPKETCGIFKRFYENLAQSLLDQLPPAPNKFNKQTTRDYYDRFNIENLLKFETIDSAMILDILSKTNISKAPGMDKLPGTCLRDGTAIIIVPLTQIINLSIVTSKFPDLCKIAKLIALFKKGSRTEAKNYRPISLLPLLSKLFEKVIHIQTEKFLNSNDILYTYQSGFRPRHSTESCLTHLVDRFLEGCDRGLHTGMILIDLQKAFDTINYDILLEKMEHINFSPETICWFKSYISNRSFIVNVDSSFSEPADLNCGVP